MARRDFFAFRSHVSLSGVVLLIFACVMQDAMAINCTGLSGAAQTQCLARQRACLATCRGTNAAACQRGCRQDFELAPDEYIVEVATAASPSGRGSSDGGPRPTASPTAAAEIPFSIQQQEAQKVLLNALMSLGLGVSESDATPKAVQIRDFDTTPFVFIVSKLSEDAAKELEKQRGIVSVSQMAKPMLVVEVSGAIDPQSGGSATIHPRQIYLENDGRAQVQESFGNRYVARANVDIDVLDGWTKSTRMGEGAVIAVIDDGFDLNNPNLVGNVAVNSREIDCNGVDDDGNGYIDDRQGWNSATKTGCSAEMTSASGHGTHVAGLAAALPRSSGDRLSGAAPFARFLPVKASQQEKLEDGLVVSTFDSASLTEAYRFVLARKRRGENIKVINLSLAVPCEAVTGVEISLLTELAAEGVSVVVAAGNAGRNVDDSRFCPASLDIPGLVSVANTAPSGRLHTTSNFGSRSITTAAPGTVIYGVNDKVLTGTSMAAPLVSGVVALMYSVQPLLSPADVQAILLQAKKGFSGAPDLKVKSKGVVSASLAVQKAKEWKVFGAVLEGDDNRPLSGVKVRMSSSSTGPVEGTTDSRGRFALPRPRNGEPVTLSFEKNGYRFGGEMSNPNYVSGNAPRQVLEFTIFGARTEVARGGEGDGRGGRQRFQIQ